MAKEWEYRSGDWWIICDVCSKKIHASESKKRWDGLIVCENDFEQRHPQDFVKTKKDKITVPFTRPRPADVFVPSCTYKGSSCISDYAVADCAIADRPYNPDVDLGPPSGTF